MVVQLSGEGCNEEFNGVAADTVCGFSNDGSIDGGLWPNFDNHGDEITNLEQNAFTEFGINVSNVLGFTPCISSVNFHTRSSQSFTAELKDFALADFNICGSITIVKDSDPDDGTDFEFTRDFGGNFSLDDSADGNAGADLPESITFSGLLPGDRDVTELIDDVEGWELVDIQCASSVNSAIVLFGDGTTFDSTFDAGVDDTVRITLVLGENVTCTFFNQQMPNVTVEKTAVNPTISAGETAIFTITVTNLGPGTAEGVTLIDNLPKGPADSLTWTEDPNNTLCTIDDTDMGSGNALLCTIGDMAEDATFTVTVKATTAFVDCGGLPNTATVSATNEDPTMDSDNEDSAAILVLCPNLVVDKQGQIRYRIEVTNEGLGTAFDVRLEDELPGGGLLFWTIVSLTSGCTITDGNILRCGPAASFGPGGTFAVIVRANITAFTCGSNVPLLENEATASADNHEDVSDTAVICEPSQ